MKPISTYVSEDDYEELKSIAARSGRPVAELIRDAMSEFLTRERREGESIRMIAPHPSGELRASWTREDLLDEMIDRS